MKKQYFFLSILLGLASQLLAQPCLDSLRQVAQLPGSNRPEAMVALATHYLDRGSDSTLYGADQLLHLVEDTPEHAHLFRALSLRGLWAYQQGDYPQALD